MDLAVVLAVVGMVFVGMQTYIKRGIQGKVKGMTDLIISGGQSAGDSKTSTHIPINIIESTMTLTGFEGGSRNLNGIEHSFKEYHSKSE